jgi:hypothetical protein
VAADLRAIVECLLAAHYSEREILDYLVGPLGTTEREAHVALEAALGPSRFGPRTGVDFMDVVPDFDASCEGGASVP